MSQHVLFYSDLCGFSSQVLNLITRKNISSSFLFVNVDVHRSELPCGVERVPTVRTNDRRHLEGQAVFDLIESMQMARNVGSMGTPTSRGTFPEPEAGASTPTDYDGGGGSEGYSFIQPGQQVDGPFAGIRDDLSIYCAPDDSRTGGASGSGSGSGYNDADDPKTQAENKFLAQREIDDKIIFGKKQAGQSQAQGHWLAQGQGQRSRA